MNVLVVADIHGDFETLSSVLNGVDFSFDVVVCPGDFTDIGLSLMGISREDTTQLVLDELLSFGKPVLVVPGNHDPPEMHHVFDEYGVNLHGKGRKIGDVGFFGFGGAKTPFETPFEPTENDTTTGLAAGFKAVADAKNKFIITHNPPKNTKLDMLGSGIHVGSQAVRDFILKHKPDAGACAHIHESNGVDVLDNTKLVYPGVASEGWVGLVSYDGETINVEIKNTLKNKD